MISELIEEAETLKAHIDEVHASVAEEEKRYKALSDMIKNTAIGYFKDGDKKVSLPGKKYSWEVSKSVSTTIDKDKLSEDGIIDKYSKQSVTFRLSTKAQKES